MLHHFISHKKNNWFDSSDCTVKELVNYIKQAGKLRDAQIEAIETYLFLKIKGENKPLWQLFSEGFFTENIDLSTLNINQKAREFLSQNTAALALYSFSKTKIKKTTVAPTLEKQIIKTPSQLDYIKIIKDIFYGVSYTDYLMSLPMGAGKTYLMAAFMYLDLYFAQNEPQNKNFAHNFLVLIPSGLKSSIVPSLKTIENFDPAWVVPEPAASNLKKILKFEILDEQKTSKTSNKARNPNAQKVNACLPNPFGQVFVVNAEKIILESFEFNNQTELVFDKSEKNEEKEETTNDLKRLFGQIPNLSILIDEVHHAATSTIKLRQAVDYWNKKGNITTVLGFSGTPYLSKQETIYSTDFSFKFTQITNTVYYYPLVTAIKKFLKTPTIKTSKGLERLEIIKNGIEDFDKLYKNKVYQNNAIPKIAIYCSNIEALETEIYPFLQTELKLHESEILRFHKGNKAFPQPEGSELEFRSLNLPSSKKRYILLVQVGKEGWDCPSLAGVILSQKGDSPKNMILQTACRCLRQVDKGNFETALIWLNAYNADILNKQLQNEQNTTIEELNKLKSNQEIETIKRHSRIDFLDIPAIDFYQMRINYQTIEEEETPQTKQKLDFLLKNIDFYKEIITIRESQIENLDTGETYFIENKGNQIAHFNHWIFEISKQSFSLIPTKELEKYKNELKIIFDKITYFDSSSNWSDNGVLYFNSSYDIYQIQSKIRLAFSIKRNLQTSSEIISKEAQLLVTEKLTNAEKNKNLFPNEEETQKILELDKSGKSTDTDEAELKKKFEIAEQALKDQGIDFPMDYGDYIAKNSFSDTIKSKNKTFHYLPYNFGGSGSSNFEFEMLKETLNLKDFKTKNLEIYYNGERGLTQFVIDCFAKTNKYWKNIGRYTTDFLIIQRKNKSENENQEENNQIHKALLLETKGAGFANEPVFLKKKKYIETKFLEINKEKFGYQKFDFIYLEDSQEKNINLSKLNQKINEFFTE